MPRLTRVYRLDVTYPPGSEPPDWTPPDDPWADPFTPYTFQWPPVRRYLTRPAAEKRAALLRSHGATVTVVPSDPVTWPDPGGHRDQ